MELPSFGRALAHRNYRLFLFGQAISLIGTWMQQVAMAWLLYRTTKSALLLGLITFASQIPSLFFSPLAGVAADRWNRHRAVLATQSLAMLQAVLLLFVTRLEGSISLVLPLIGLGLLLGIINAFDMPIRQAFLADMIGRKQDLGNAIALNSSIVNGARLVGPSLAGVVIAIWGEYVCFLLNAVSYLAVLLALLAMRDLPPRFRRPQGKISQHLREGFAYAFGFPPLRALLLMMGVVSFMAAPLSVLMPVYATEVMRGNAQTQGFLMGAMGAGAFLGATYLATRKSVLGLGRHVAAAAMLFGAGMMAFSYSPYLWLSLPLLVVTGFAMMLHMAGCNTLIQTIVSEDKRGRVMSFYSMAFVGATPLGSLLGGALASRFGAPLAVLSSGVVCILAALVFWRQLPHMRRLVRPIYEEAGILPSPTPEFPKADAAEAGLAELERRPPQAPK